MGLSLYSIGHKNPPPRNRVCGHDDGLWSGHDAHHIFLYGLLSQTKMSVSEIGSNCKHIQQAARQQTHLDSFHPC